MQSRFQTEEEGGSVPTAAVRSTGKEADGNTTSDLLSDPNLVNLSELYFLHFQNGDNSTGVAGRILCNNQINQ